MRDSPLVFLLLWATAAGAAVWAFHGDELTPPSPVRTIASEGEVQMSKREFEALKRLLEAQKKAITDNEDMFILWRDKYDDAEECVRERTESNEQVLTCFNDTAT